MSRHHVSISVIADSPDEFHVVWAKFAKLTNAMVMQHPNVTQSSMVLDENDTAFEEELYHDEYTMIKVAAAINGTLRHYNIPTEAIRDAIINEMLNKGILFRERSKSND